MIFTFDYWILGLRSINHFNHGHHRPAAAAAATLLLILLTPPTTAQPASPQSPTDDNYYSPKFSPSMGVVIIILISALFLMGFFSMYIRSCSEGGASTANNTRTITGRSRRGPRGLEPTVIENFPTFEFAAVKSLHLGKDALECAICLNEFEDNETLRLIPKCDHVFHPECIGEWLAAHTTCPVCRADLTPQPDESIHAPNLTSELSQICELGHQHSDDEHSGGAVASSSQNQTGGTEVVIEVMGQPLLPPSLPPSSATNVSSEKRDQQPVDYPYPLPPLNRNRTRRWLGAMFTRSNSTGHVAVKQWENMERFTLRIPDDVRKQIISGKLNRTTSCLALPAGEESSRRGYRVGDCDNSSRAGRRYYGEVNGRSVRRARSDRWVFSMMPPFFSRASSMRSQRAGSVSRRSGGGGSVRSNRDDGSDKGDSMRGGSVRSNRDDGSVKGDSLRGSVRGDEPGLPPV